MKSEEIGILRENNAAFHAGIFQLLKILNSDKIHVGRGRDVNPTMSKRPSNRVVDVFVKVKQHRLDAREWISTDAPIHQSREVAVTAQQVRRHP